jgi:dCTP deaminase
MLLAHDEIEDLIDLEIVEYAEKALINSASLDIRLGMEILVERPAPLWTPTSPQDGLVEVSLKNRNPLNMIGHNLKDHGPFKLYPGEFILAHSVEVFNLPNHISASYALKSSMARIGLEHLNAGWCDAGWNGSSLTLELKNITRYHVITLEYLDKIGQMCFFKHKAVKPEHSYATKGRYNGDRGVQGTRQLPQEIEETLARGVIVADGDEAGEEGYHESN